MNKNEKTRDRIHIIPINTTQITVTQYIVPRPYTALSCTYSYTDVPCKLYGYHPKTCKCIDCTNAYRSTQKYRPNTLLYAILYKICMNLYKICIDTNQKNVWSIFLHRSRTHLYNLLPMHLHILGCVHVQCCNVYSKVAVRYCSR